MELTALERKHARHALGLPNKLRKSYRNRYVVSQSTETGEIWMGMFIKGAADLDPDWPGSNCLFFLTRKGALAALNKGERLCEEDFPKEAA